MQTLVDKLQFENLTCMNINEIIISLIFFVNVHSCPIRQIAVYFYHENNYTHTIRYRAQ